MSKRIRPHQIEPGTQDQVLTTDAGVAKWGARVDRGLVPVSAFVNGSPELLWDSTGELLVSVEVI